MCKLRLRLATRKVENRSLKDKVKEVNAINTQGKVRVLNNRINEDLHLRLVASVDHLHRGRIKMNKLERKLCIQRMDKDVNLHLDVSLLRSNQGGSLLLNNQEDNHLHSSQGDNPLHSSQGDNHLHSSLEDSPLHNSLEDNHLHNNQGDSLPLNNSRESSLDVNLLLRNQGDNHPRSSQEDNPLLNSLNRGISSVNSQRDASLLHSNQGDNHRLSSLEDNLLPNNLSREISNVNNPKDVSHLLSSHNKVNNRLRLFGGKQLMGHKAIQILNTPTKSPNHLLSQHGLQGQLIIQNQ